MKDTTKNVKKTINLLISNKTPIEVSYNDWNVKIPKG